MKGVDPPDAQYYRNYNAESLLVARGIQGGLGFLLVLHKNDLVVDQVSSNILSLLGWRPEDVIGRPVDYILDVSSVSSLRNSFVHDDFSRVNAVPLIFRTPLGVPASEQHWLGIPHISSEGVILEVERSTSRTRGGGESKNFAHVMQLGKLRTCCGPSEFVIALSDEISRMCAFHRTMAYEILADGHGRVIHETFLNETIKAKLEPLVKLHFPASDIPDVIKKLYLSQRVRAICDNNEPEVPIVPAVNPRTRKPADLSRVNMRGTIPCHSEYMKNMGVAASLTISVVVKGVLWGLIVCHHTLPRFIGHNDRVDVRDLAEYATAFLQRIGEDSSSLVQTRQAEVFETMMRGASLSGGLLDSDVNIMKLVSCCGVALVKASVVQWRGRAPREDHIRALVQFLGGKSISTIWHTQSLPQELPAALEYREQACGVLAANIGAHPNGSDAFILWFRPETCRTVPWAGNQAVQIRPSPDAGQSNGCSFAPRQSFRRHDEKVALTSHRWSNTDVDMAAMLRTVAMAYMCSRDDLPFAPMSHLQRRASLF